MINLFYLSGNTTGGWVTYTAHLCKGLDAIKAKYQLYKIGNRTERKLRNFGYSLKYQNVTYEDACGLVDDNPSVILALQKNYREAAKELITSSAWMVVHDPAEFKHLKEIGLQADKCITIRKAVQKQLKGSYFIPHPYHRHYEGSMSDLNGRGLACSICRIDFDKHTHILLDANRLIRKRKLWISINGFENRLYTRFKIVPNYPEWEQSKVAYPREVQQATGICENHVYTIDMSLIKGDGGGTQYSFMEAMDAGSINIINTGWIKPKDEMIPYPNKRANCLIASDGQELAALLTKPINKNQLISLRNSGIKLLEQHNAAKIALQFAQLLGAA